MSHGLAPSKSTVYISNLPYELRNNDLHKIFEKHGRIIRVTVLKDKETRRSKGVAFLLYLKREDAKKCVEETNMKEMFGRTLKASIAKDNGRHAEFIKKRYYPDKSFCYECGEEGHLSYKCSRNLLGEREPPPKKVKKKKRKYEETEQATLSRYESSDEDSSSIKDEPYQEDCETLSAAIALEQERLEIENYRLKVASGNYEDSEEKDSSNLRKKIKKSSYFSDEEESE